MPIKKDIFTNLGMYCFVQECILFLFLGDYYLSSEAESFIQRNLTPKQGIEMCVDRFDELLDIFYVNVVIEDSDLMDIMIRSGLIQGYDLGSENNDIDHSDDFIFSSSLIQ